MFSLSRPRSWIFLVLLPFPSRLSFFVSCSFGATFLSLLLSFEFQESAENSNKLLTHSDLQDIRFLLGNLRLSGCSNLRWLKLEVVSLGPHALLDSLPRWLGFTGLYTKNTKMFLLFHSVIFVVLTYEGMGVRSPSPLAPSLLPLGLMILPSFLSSGALPSGWSLRDCSSGLPTEVSSSQPTPPPETHSGRLSLRGADRRPLLSPRSLHNLLDLLPGQRRLAVPNDSHALGHSSSSRDFSVRLLL